jgi:hypothetical protein
MVYTNRILTYDIKLNDLIYILIRIMGSIKVFYIIFLFLTKSYNDRAYLLNIS